MPFLLVVVATWVSLVFFTAIVGASETLDEIEEQFTEFHDLVTTSDGEVNSSRLGKLAVFSGVREFPMRVKCATLSWHTLRAALDEKDEVARTE